MKLDDKSRLLNKTTITSTCWEWNGERIKGGYGRIRYKGKKWLTHRLAYLLFIGEFNQELDVCHTCDNPACINPEHLFLGTAQDNMNDMKRKNRSHKSYGEKNPNVSLSTKIVKNIRDEYKLGNISIRALGRKYSTPHSNIRSILEEKTWKNMDI